MLTDRSGPPCKRHFKAFDLTIESDVPLLELRSLPDAETPSAPDVRIVEKRFGRADFPLIPGNSWFRIVDGILYFAIDRVGRFSVSGGSLIRFERDATLSAPGVSDADIRVFVLGSGLGAILQQRRVLALHASCAVVAGHGVAIMGPSGAGKSTTLAALVAGGHEMLSDDVSAIDLRPEEGPHVRAAYPQLKLNPDSVARLEIEPTELGWLNRFRTKHVLTRDSSLREDGACLSALFVLESHDDDARHVVIEPIEGAARFAALHRNTYRQCFHAGFGLEEFVMQAIGHVARHCDVYRLTRPRRFRDDDEPVTTAILHTLEQLNPDR